MAREAHGQRLLGVGHRHVALLELQLAVHAGGDPLAGQLAHLGGAVVLGLGHILLRIGIAELRVGAGDVGRHLDACRLRLDLRRAGLADGSLPGGALAAPQIQAPVEAGIAVLGHGEAGFFAQQRRRRAGAGDCRATVDRGSTLGIGGPGRRLCGTCPCIGHRQAWVVAQRLVDQSAELGIAQAGPPVLLRPGRDIARQRRQRTFGLEPVGGERPAVWLQAGGRGAAGQGQGQGGRRREGLQTHDDQVPSNQFLSRSACSTRAR